MRCLLIIYFIFTFNTLLLLASSDPFNWPPLGPAIPPAIPPVDAQIFYWCMSFNPSHANVSHSNVYSPAFNKSSFTSILNSTAQNLRCLEDSYRKPILIFRPTDERQVSDCVWCARRYNLNIRVRSGGHDYEGLSFTSLMKNQQFMILDLFNLRDVSIDTESGTAWVQAGATNGELYYRISQINRTLAFPAGLCTSLGIGGHLTGGAYGSMMREFGLGADNVVDVRMVDAWGTVRSRVYGGMNEDLFWALKGGGGGSFGVILAWQVKLVTVPWNVTMFTSVIPREPNGAEILLKWQEIAPKVDSKLFIRVIMMKTGKTVISIYQALYLGSAKDLVSLMRKKFPDLGVMSVDKCTEMSWIQSVLNIAGFPANTKPDYLLQGKPAFPLLYMKAKSDFLRQPMSKKDIEGMWDILMEQGSPSLIIWNPYGGKMAEIAEDSIPFPHRAGVICKIQYVATWLDPSPESQLMLEDWMRVLYEYMRPHVSQNPRESYVNYRDLDIGKKEGSGSNCSYPLEWGPKYFKDNFQKLVQVKSRVDPWNFFKHEQSIPTYWTRNQCTDVV